MNKPFGPDLIQLIRERNWNSLVDHRQACEFLAAQCCICDFHFSRPQELHSHLRVHHPKWVPHTFTKASQLCRSYARNSPCRHCGLSFRQAHTCPIITQAAMLLLHMPTASGHGETPPLEALRCEVCGLRASSLDEIHRHLADSHRLAFHDWQPERDLMGKDPACSQLLPGVLQMWSSSPAARDIRAMSDVRPKPFTILVADCPHLESTFSNR